MRNLKPLGMMLKLNHAEVWLANLNLGRGTEPGKTGMRFIFLLILIFIKDAPQAGRLPCL